MRRRDLHRYEELWSHRCTPPDVRAKVLERDKRCVICGQEAGLEVHHIEAALLASVAKNHDLSNLVTLCRVCHKGVTAIQVHHPTIYRVIIKPWLQAKVRP